MLASLLPPSTRIRAILAPPLEVPSFFPQIDGIHTASTGLLSLVTLDVRFSSVLSYKPSRSFGHGFFSSLNARLAQRLSCARAQGVALLGGYSVYSEAVPESRLSLSLSSSSSQLLSLSLLRVRTSAPDVLASRLRPLWLRRLLVQPFQALCYLVIALLFVVLWSPSFVQVLRLTADKAHTLSAARRAGQRRIVRSETTCRRPPLWSIKERACLATPLSCPRPSVRWQSPAAGYTPNQQSPNTVVPSPDSGLAYLGVLVASDGYSSPRADR